MQKNNRTTLDNRHLVILLVICVLTMLFLIRLFSLQIIDTYVYERQADAVSRRQEVIPAQRGEIFDRNFDQPLVSNIESFVVTINLQEVPSEGLDALIRDLAEVLQTEEYYLWDNISSPKQVGLRTYEVWNGASYRQIAYLAENIDNFPGLSWNSGLIREYTQNESLAHVLGYVGEISSEELQILYNQGYSSAHEIGKTGIEKQYDFLLRGTDGLRYQRFDARGRQIRELEDIPPIPGKSIVLTIDREIQGLAEKALGNRTGGVVVLDPKNGEIIAMVSYPSYNPNIFSVGTERQQMANINSNPQSPLLNRTIQAVGSPASTFKILMGLAMLQEQAFEPEDTIHCSGSIWVGNREFKCHVETGHGHVNFYSALAESCNVYFYTVGKDYLGVETIVDYSLLFGLGDFTTIDLPGEKTGLVPTPEWKERIYSDSWKGGDTVNLSIGQGYLAVTPLQLSNITASIYNNGIIYQPRILKEVRDQRSLQLIEEIEPRILRDTGLDEEVYEHVQRAMRRVITNGTPRDIITNSAEYIAAKTGTAERGGENDPHSWFTSYISLGDDREYVITVWVDGFNEWEWWAPKAANIIMHGITNDLSYEEAVTDLQPYTFYLYNTDI